MDPPEPEIELLELELESPPRALIRATPPPHTLLAPAALLRVLHALLPVYAVLARLAQFAQWRGRRD